LAVPDYQSVMLPLLRYSSDGQEKRFSETVADLAEKLGLTDEDLSEQLPSGTQSLFTNRVGWALTYLKKAELFESTGRGLYRLTTRGADVLASNPSEINIRFLKQFPEFVAFQKKQKPVPSGDVEDNGGDERTPEEVLELSYQELRRALGEDILAKVKAAPPVFLEKLVVQLLVAMGYGGTRKDAGQAVGRSGDGGVDGIIKEDKLGLDAIYIQAKRWDNVVGRPAIQAFAGTLDGNRARKGVFITTSWFSSEALEYVKIIEKRIVLIDGDQLAQLMIDHNVGVTEDKTFVVKRLDLDYFEDAE